MRTLEKEWGEKEEVKDWEEVEWLEREENEQEEEIKRNGEW